MDRMSEQERHRRRVQLLMMQGENNRREDRAHFLMALAAALGVVAIAMFVLIS